MADLPIPFSGPMSAALLAGRKTQTRRAIGRLRGLGEVTEFGPSTTAGYDWHCRDEGKRWHDLRHHELVERLPYRVGDRLWVREAWRTWRDDDEMSPRDIVELMDRDEDPDWRPNIEFLADGAIIPRDFESPWDPGRRRAGMHLPRRLSRTTLVVTEVRVQRLQEISEADAIAEGFMALTKDGKTVKYGIPDRDGLPGGDDHGWPWPEWNADPRKAYATLWDRINGRGAWAANPEVAAYTLSVHRCNIDAFPEE